MKKRFVVLVAVLATLAMLGGSATAHPDGTISASVTGTTTFPGFAEIVKARGMYNGHGHARACINVTLQEQVSGSTFADVGNNAQSCEQPADGNLSALSQDNCQDIVGFYRTYRAKVRFRTWGPNGTPTGDVTRFVGQNGQISADCFF